MNIVVISPQSQSAKTELAHRVSLVHAEHILKAVQQLRCTSIQKQQLIDAVLGKVAYQPKENTD